MGKILSWLLFQIKIGMLDCAYHCLETNLHGRNIPREARLQFAWKFSRVQKSYDKKYKWVIHNANKFCAVPSVNVSGIVIVKIHLAGQAADSGKHNVCWHAIELNIPGLAFWPRLSCAWIKTVDQILPSIARVEMIYLIDKKTGIISVSLITEAAFFSCLPPTHLKKHNVLSILYLKFSLSLILQILMHLSSHFGRHCVLNELFAYFIYVHNCFRIRDLVYVLWWFFPPFFSCSIALC